MERSGEIDKLSAAIVKVHGSIKAPERRAENPYFHSKYADLEEVRSVSKDTLAANGLALVQWPTGGKGELGLTTMLLHESGQFISENIAYTLGDKNTIQTAGGALTYLRRYGAMAVLGLAPVDDDGNEAGGTKAENGESGEKQTEADNLFREIRADLKRCLDNKALSETACTAFKTEGAKALEKHDEQELKNIQKRIRGVIAMGEKKNG